MLMEKNLEERFDRTIKEFADKNELTDKILTELMIRWLDENIAMKRGFSEREFEKIINALINNDLSEAVAILSDRILIANWFGKETIENLTNTTITEREFKELVKRWNKYGLHDDISEIVRNFIEEEIENLTNTTITEREFEELVKRWNKYGLYDDISEIVRNFIEEELKDMRNKTKIKIDGKEYEIEIMEEKGYTSIFTFLKDNERHKQAFLKRHRDEFYSIEDIDKDMAEGGDRILNVIDSDTDEIREILNELANENEFYIVEYDDRKDIINVKRVKIKGIAKDEKPFGD